MALIELVEGDGDNDKLMDLAGHWGEGTAMRERRDNDSGGTVTRKDVGVRYQRT